MRTWFAKTIGDAQPSPHPGVEAPAEKMVNVSASPKTHEHRRVVYAPVLPSGNAESVVETIRIKAHIDSTGEQIVFMIDRPILDGYSYWCSNPANAAVHSTLAAALFDLSGVKSVLIHEMNVTVVLNDAGGESVEVDARRFGHAIRTHLESGRPAMDESFVANLPSEDEIRERLQSAIDNEINPGISGHSGEITLTAVVGNTAYIKMGGGCQGCAASSITLRQGVDQSFRNAVPQLGALLDETDHAAGSNPFFSVLPDGMRA